MPMAGLQRWCELLAANAPTAAALKPATLVWLLNDVTLTADFFSNLSMKDRTPKVLNLLQEFHEAEPTRFPVYNRVAIAMALVWDDPPHGAPHHQVAADAVPLDTSTPVDRFRFWIDTQEKKTSDYELPKLEVEQLKFVVDAAAPLDELRWAQTSARFSRGTFERAFFAVKYDEARIEKGVYVWPHKEYSLKEIRKLGGICVDQAYFAVTAGKASGIPTLFFTGEGRRGGHAWFGYMKNPDRWDMDCGRYQYDKYATGTARDPQTGESISDHELAFLAEPFRNSAEYRLSMAHLRQGQLFLGGGNAARALEAADAALLQCRQNLAAWEFKTRLLEGGSPPGTGIGAHLNAMIQQFNRYPDIKTSCQEKLAKLAREKGDTKTAAQIEDRMIRDNRNKRQDLSAAVFQKKLAECCDKGDWKGGQAVVHDAIMKLKDETGPVFELAQYFVARCLQSGQAEEANRALKDFKNRMHLDPIVTAQFERLSLEVKRALREQPFGKKK